MLAFYDQSSNPAEAYSLSVTFALEKIEKQKKRPGSAHEKNSYDDTVRLLLLLLTGRSLPTQLRST